MTITEETKHASSGVITGLDATEYISDQHHPELPPTDYRKDWCKKLLCYQTRDNSWHLEIHTVDGVIPLHRGDINRLLEIMRVEHSSYLMTLRLEAARLRNASGAQVSVGQSIVLDGKSPAEVNV